MSPASYLTAPPRVAARSIALSGYDRGVSAVLWGAVAFCSFVALATLVGFVLLALRGLRLFKTLRSGLLGALDELAVSAGRVESRLGSVEEKSAELQRALARLQRTLAETRILIRAAGEFGDLVGRVRGIVPTK